jgi:pyruvate kinase
LTSHTGKRTKIVATIGPSSRSEATIRQMIRAGMDVARINFSHGKHEEHGWTIDAVRRIAQEEGAVVAIMCDIQGPKIRIGKIAAGPIILAAGDRITLTLDEADGTNNVVSLPHPEFMRDIRQGTHLLLDDGKLEFEVKSTLPRGLVCEVIVGGPISSNKGVSAPNARLTLSAITEKDRADIEFALSRNTDYIAMSFVRSPNDLQEMRWLIRHSGGTAAIIAKIEMHEALENIDAIINSADGVMVARGDLGVEVSVEEVPFHQKKIIKLCNEAGKPVITATQMLNSMEHAPRPTRAEASDVYNAILDGTDAVMLSNETAAGDYPVRAVETMVNIAAIAERNLRRAAESGSPLRVTRNLEGREAISDAIAQSTWQVAEALNCRAILTATLSGYTTKQVARVRPKTPIICVTPNETTYKRTALLWGATPLLVKEEFNTVDEMVRIVVRAAQGAGLVEIGDSIVIIAGVPFGMAGQTNFLKLHVVGESGELDPAN